MLNDDRTPQTELVQEQSSTPPPKRPTVLQLQAASLELYDVALRAREICALTRAIPGISSDLNIKIQIFEMVTGQAIAKAEAAL